MVELTGHRTIGDSIAELIATWTVLPVTWPWMVSPPGMAGGARAAGRAGVATGATATAFIMAGTEPSAAGQLRPPPMLARRLSAASSTFVSTTTTATTTRRKAQTEVAGDGQHPTDNWAVADASTSAPAAASMSDHPGSPGRGVRQRRADERSFV